MTAGLAWYRSDRASFLKAELDRVVGELADAATQSGLHIEPEQNEEWRSSIGVLQEQLSDRVELIRRALQAPDLAAYSDIILEYDFKRRGLRLDCVLLGEGIIAVLEFKRSQVVAADRDQVTNYCVNLVEFHEETRRACEEEAAVVVPVLAVTTGLLPAAESASIAFHNAPWNSVVREPLLCDSETLAVALRVALRARRADVRVSADRWLASRFAPSSTIVDAAISLYGDHDVSAIQNHASSAERIRDCTEEVAQVIEQSKKDRQNRIIFVSGAPGAGKTLVGLKLAFDPRFRSDAVFVTGNAPLVDVLSEALEASYRRGQRRRDLIVQSGYSKEDVHQVVRMANYRIVKAHSFLKERGSKTGSADGNVVVFDEAQRTYAKGREVLRKKLEEDEAELILRSLEASYPDRGAVVVALLGHNQAINKGELGAVAWFNAAKRRGWRYAISEETLALSEVARSGDWGTEPLREVLRTGHLPHSLRHYRNGGIEEWAAAVLENDSGRAAALATAFPAGDTIWLTRELAHAKTWARRERVGDERAGLIASGQARRLAAEGLFVDLKPDIAKWVLAPRGDIRSSNMLETVQNQFQIQGLEIDYTIVCWDADLRRIKEEWRGFQVRGAAWQADKQLDVAKNSYRVLLTRSRKGMTIFVPRGDLSGEDPTRDPAIYDEIAGFLLKCGAKSLPA